MPTYIHPSGKKIMSEKPLSSEQLEEAFGIVSQGQPLQGAESENIFAQHAKNLPGSIYKDVLKPIFSPETWKGLGKLAEANQPVNIMLTGLQGGDPLQGPKSFYEMGKGLISPYATEQGLSWKKTKETFAKHPGQIWMDLAGLLTGAGGLIGKGSKVGQVISKVGEFADPLADAAKLVGAIAKPIKGTTTGALGISTGASKIPIEKALEGGEAFKQALRGGIEGTEIVNQAKGGLASIAAKRSQEYVAEFQKLKGMPNFPVLDLTKPMQEFVDICKDFNVDPILNAQGKVIDLNFKNSVLRNNAPARSDFTKIFDTIKNTFDDPKLYSTPEGFDRLKKQIGMIYRESDQGGLAVTRVYDSVRKQLVDKVPGYEQMVGNYEKTTKLMSEIERTLSLKKSGTADTALRKLNTALREDDDLRRGLIKEVDKASNKDIAGSISGRLMSTWMPKSWIGREIAVGSMFGAIFGNPAILPALATSSPRLVAETMILLGKVNEGKKLLQKYGATAPVSRQVPYQASKSNEQRR